LASHYPGRSGKLGVGARRICRPKSTTHGAYTSAASAFGSDAAMDGW
jgi:hypothetical protein